MGVASKERRRRRRRRLTNAELLSGTAIVGNTLSVNTQHLGTILKQDSEVLKYKCLNGQQ